ncbi:hypothetical protein HU200_042215 [Digitaria exilis]|uniref:Uncharacterized protein n=1 Tax=Digitaria exilis TaxID=1010633 RepID=A0A835EIJ2_9POAL|nr:hypothetical protein HU200_042215 [Digitaria exilis]
MVGRPSIEAMAMAGADWAQYCIDDEGSPPEHLRAFDAFLETVVPPDMALAFSRDEAAASARCGGRRQRSHREDVEEKLKLWAKAVAREVKAGVLGRSSQPATSRRRAHAREPAILARPPGEPNSFASGGKEKERRANNLANAGPSRQARLPSEHGATSSESLLGEARGALPEQPTTP